MLARKRGRSRGKGRDKSASKSRKKGSRSRRKWTFDTVSAAREIASMILERWGLDLLGIDADFLVEIIYSIVSDIVASRASKPTVEGLYRNLDRNRRFVLKAIAAKLLERESLTPEQLDFILAYAPDLAGKAAPHLYRQAVRAGADHIVDALRALWIQYGKPTPIECPYCGFRSVAPDLTCIVCGKTIEEHDLKKSIRFAEKLEQFADTAPRSLVLEVLSAGFVLYDGEIKPPSMRSSSPLAVELFLSREEKELLKKRLEERARSIEHPTPQKS